MHIVTCARGFMKEEKVFGDFGVRMGDRTWVGVGGGKRSGGNKRDVATSSNLCIY